MIEVEQKFLLNPEQEAKLLEGATLDYEKVNVDIFFDDDYYSLGKQDVWLRNRNGRWELKIGHKLSPGSLSRTYEELEEDGLIATWLGLPGEDLTQEILNAGYKQFAKIEKARRSYLREGFRLDLDKCDFGYDVAEIELLIDSIDGQQEANDKIAAFAKSIGLDNTPLRGKPVEYLYRFLPDHYQALLEAGVLDKI
jgi:adenylate cyclase class IV